MLKSTDILDAVEQLNWMRLENLDMRRVVSCVTVAQLNTLLGVYRYTKPWPTHLQLTCACDFHNSRIQLLAMAFLQAEVLSISNGIAKCVATRTIDVVLNVLVCARHKVSVFRYIYYCLYQNTSE